MERFKGKSLYFIVLLAVFLNSFWIWWGLPNGAHTWATDHIAPLGPLVAAKHMFIDDWWNSGYYNKFPMGHFFILMVAYAPYILYLYATGSLTNPTEVYPFGLTDPETTLMILSLIANGVSALMGVGIVILTYLAAQNLFGRKGAICAALIVAFSPPFIYYAHTSNVDIPSLFWCSLGLFAFAHLVRGRVELYSYALLGFAVGMAMATKEQVYGLFILLPFPILALHIRHHLEGELRPSEFIRAIFHPKILCGLGMSLITFILATHLIFNWDGNLLRLNYRATGFHPVLGLAYGEDFRIARAAMHGHWIAVFLGRWQETFVLMAGIMNPFLFLAGLGGLLYFPFKERWSGFFIVPLFSYLFFVVMPSSIIRARFVMELVLVMALFGGRFLAGVWHWGEKHSRAIVVLLSLLFVYSFVYGFNVDYLMMRDARYEAEAWIQTHFPPGAKVETYSQATYLPRIPEYIDVQRSLFTEEALQSLRERSPDYLVLTSAQYHQYSDGSPQQKLLARLLRGGYGYRPIQTFRTEALIGPNLIPGLSPEIILLKKP